MIDDGRRRLWVNVYRPLIGASGTAYETRELADQMAGRGRIACVEIKFEAGEGLDADEQKYSTG